MTVVIGIETIPPIRWIPQALLTHLLHCTKTNYPTWGHIHGLLWTARQSRIHILLTELSQIVCDMFYVADKLWFIVLFRAERRHRPLSDRLQLYRDLVGLRHARLDARHPAALDTSPPDESGPRDLSGRIAAR